MFGTMVGNQEGSLAFARACVDEKKLSSSPQIAAGDFVVYTPLARAAEFSAANVNQSLRPENVNPADSELAVQNYR